MDRNEKDAVKHCKRCGRTLPLSAFGRNVRNTDGLQTYCIECNRAHWRAQHGSLARIFRTLSDDVLLAEMERRGYVLTKRPDAAE